MAESIKSTPYFNYGDHKRAEMACLLSVNRKQLIKIVTELTRRTLDSIFGIRRCQIRRRTSYRSVSQRLKPELGKYDRRLITFNQS